jgi:hypothetical protein
MYNVIGPGTTSSRIAGPAKAAIVDASRGTSFLPLPPQRVSANRPEKDSPDFGNLKRRIVHGPPNV